MLVLSHSHLLTDKHDDAATVAPSILAMSNGMSGKDRAAGGLSSTSKGAVSGAAGLKDMLPVVLALVPGALMAGMGLMR